MVISTAKLLCDEVSVDIQLCSDLYWGVKIFADEVGKSLHNTVFLYSSQKKARPCFRYLGNLRYKLKPGPNEDES